MGRGVSTVNDKNRDNRTKKEFGGRLQRLKVSAKGEGTKLREKK